MLSNIIMDLNAGIKNNKLKSTVIAVFVLTFIILMILVWSPSSLNLSSEPCGKDNCYWIGLAVGVNVMLVPVLYHVLFQMPKLEQK